MAPETATYTYSDVADRMEAEFGVRPSLSSLRAASATDARSPRAKSRLTADMPARLQDSVDRRAVFDAAAIESWLTHHPLRREQQATVELQTQLRSGEVEPAIKAARSAGLSWARIAAIWSDVDGRQHFTSAVHRRFRER